MTPKKQSGLERIIKAIEYSFAGIRTAWTHEAAFRQELAILAILSPIGWVLGQTGVERAVLMLSVMIMVVTELLNSAIEAVVDRIGPEFHPMAKQAKDMGSAAVFVSILIVIITWALVLI